MFGFIVKVAGTALVSAATSYAMSKAAEAAIKNDKIGPKIAHGAMQTRNLVEEQAAKYKPQAEKFNLFGKETASAAEKLIADIMAKRRGTPPGDAA